jgi:hypothetical protein
MDSTPAPPFAPASAPSFASYNVENESSSMSSLLIRGLLIILLLALIGFNVFTYMDEIVAWFSDTFGAPFRSVARFLGYAATNTAQTTIDVTAKGTKTAVDVAAGAATSGIDVLQQTIGEDRNDKDQPKHQRDQNQRKPVFQDDSLERALSHAKKQPPLPDDATSRTQRTGKSGFCYIGEDRGFRSCIKIGEQDTCMSGDIFPTQAICINPRLRQ